MVSHLVFYQLGLIALVWLFLMLYGLWPSEPAAARSRTPKPLLPQGKHSKKPKPFPGLTRKPCCAACAQVIEAPRLQPSSPPPPTITLTRGRHRHVDTTHHFCPDPDCRYGGWLGLGNIQSNGHPSGRPWRQLYCSKCHIPSDLVVDHWTSDGASRSYRDVLLLHDVWTTSNRLSGHKITLIISMA